MWLIRFQNITSNDYTKISKMCKQAWFCPKKFTAIVLVKAIITHILLKKSWRKIATQFGIPYLPIYQFYNKIKDTPELKQMLEYFCQKQVISFIETETHISRSFLQSDNLVKKSLEQIKKEYK